MRYFSARRRLPSRRPVCFVPFAALSGALLTAGTAARAQEKTPLETPTPPTATTGQAFPKAQPALPSPKNAPPAARFDGKNGSGAAAPVLPSPLTLQDAIGYALRLQPNIAASVANREGGQERLKQTKARYFPTATPSFTYNNGYTYGSVSRVVSSGTSGAATTTPTTGNTTTGTSTTNTTTGTTTRQTTTTTGGTDTGTTGTTGTTTGTTGTTGTTTGSEVVTSYQGRTTDTRSAGLAISYRLYDGGARELNSRLSRQNVRELLFSEENTRQTVIGNVADNYFATLRTNALVRVSEAQVARAQNTLDVVRAQVDAGVSPRKDIFQAQADFLNAQVNLLQARNNAANAQAQLKSTIGVVGGEPLTLADISAPTDATPATAVLDEAASKPIGTGTGPTPSATTPPASSLPTDADTINRFTDLAYRTRPDIAQAQQGVEGNQTNVSLNRLNTRVLVTSDVTEEVRVEPNHFDRSTGNNRSIGFNVSYPLFDAGLSRSQVRGAQATVRASQAQLTSLRQQIAVSVEQAFRTLTVARATLPSALAAQQAAQINYDAALASRQEGVGSIVDVITAQTALVQAQTNYVQAVYNFYTADAQLARAVGQAGRIAQTGTSPAAPGGTTTPAVPGATPATPVPTPAPVPPAGTGTSPASTPPVRTPAGSP